ncbi:SgcJ/EcaC family oxidoreductase, partial [Paraburkholderia sp. SIMBA_027]
MTEDERAIRDLVETWFVSSRRGDLATVLDLIADDAIFMVAGKPPFDKAAFAAASRDANAAAGNGPKVD